VTYVQQLLREQKNKNNVLQRNRSIVKTKPAL